MTHNARTGPGADPGLPHPSWSEVRDELARTVEQLPGLLGAVPDPQAPAVGVWTIAETAVHLSQTWAAVPPLARRDLAGVLRAVPGGEGLGTASGSVFPDTAALSRWTRRAVDAEQERDLSRLGELVVQSAAAFLAEDHDGDDGLRPWAIEGVRGRPVFFGCHLLGETLVHGDDIARAAGGLDWPIEPRAAALVLRCFMFDVFCQGINAGRQERPYFRIDMHLAGQDRFHLVKNATGMRIEPPSRRRVDVHLRADPAGLLALIWKRRSAASLLRRGQLVAWGRRPWKILDLQAIAPDV